MKCLNIYGYAVIVYTYCVLGEMSPQYLRCDAVPAAVLGCRSGRDRLLCRHHPPRRRRHHHHSSLNVCHLYKRTGQRR